MTIAKFGNPTRMPGAVKNTIPLLFVLAAVFAGCNTREGAPPPPSNVPVQLTFIHTSDWHSRLLPYDLQLAATDRRLIQRYAPDSPILEPGQSLVQIGGLTRLATLLKRERARDPDLVWVDSGDCFQGAPIFNAFNGEVEIRALSRLGVDAVVLGNHEFDKGLDNLAYQLDNWANYPPLAANYEWQRHVKGAETMARITQPYVIVNRKGLRIGIIGMANLSSLNSIGYGNNSIGVNPLDELDTAQFYIDHLAGQVDLIGITSHMGLTGHDERLEDYEVIAATTGLDFVFGGHLHVVLDPPQVRHDKTGREVILTHSGAFMKFLGRLDVVVEDSGDPYYGYEISSHRYELFPIDASIPDDLDTLRFLEPYVLEMNRKLDLTRIIAYAPRMIPRFGREKANSELGNIAAESMADRRGVQADFALTNTLGIRTDIIRGPITQDQMFNVFPFDNFVTKMFMSGREVCEMVTFVSRRSAGRGCQPQAQFSDRIHMRMNCVVDEPECSFASEVAFRDQAVFNTCTDGGGSYDDCDVQARQPIDPHRVYEVAVNDYIAGGGSGFRVLQFNNTKIPTTISIRDAVSDRFQSYPSCAVTCVDECEAMGHENCAERVAASPAGALDCESLPRCFEDVSAYRDRFCAGRDERDPRDFCAPFMANAENATFSEVEARWLNPMVAYCTTIEERNLFQEPGLAMEDECFQVSRLLTEAGRTCVPESELSAQMCPAPQTCIGDGLGGGTCQGASLDELWTEFRAALSTYGAPAPSDRCTCKLEAALAADSECRELSCVTGFADNRLETGLYETYTSAEETFSAFPDDLCAQQAIAAGCDLESLRGIANDEEPN